MDYSQREQIEAVWQPQVTHSVPHSNRRICRFVVWYARWHGVYINIVRQEGPSRHTAATSSDNSRQKNRRSLQVYLGEHTYYGPSLLKCPFASNACLNDSFEKFGLCLFLSGSHQT